MGQSNYRLRGALIEDSHLKYRLEAAYIDQAKSYHARCRDVNGTSTSTPALHLFLRHFR
jgi:hypothetical protein